MDMENRLVVGKKRQGCGWGKGMKVVKGTNFQLQDKLSPGMLCTVLTIPNNTALYI